MLEENLAKDWQFWQSVISLPVSFAVSSVVNYSSQEKVFYHAS